MAFSSWRGVVGMINPTMRPGVTEEVIRLLPEGIGLIPLFLNIRRGTEDEFAAIMPAYEERIAELAECDCDLIHPHGAPPFMVQGRKREAEIVAAWEKKYKVPIMSVAQNHVNALKTLKAKSIVAPPISHPSSMRSSPNISARPASLCAAWQASTCPLTKCRTCRATASTLTSS